MALGDNFSSKEQLQDAILKAYNPIVKRWFRDLDPPEGEWEPEITTKRGALRLACTHQEKDSCIQTNLRVSLFNLIREQEQEAQRSLVPIAGIPMGEVHATRKFKPQVFLYFQEDENDVDPGYSPVTGTIQYRIMDNDDVTPTEAQTLANRIKTEFAASGGWIWRKGRYMMTYYEKDRGYQLQILCRDELAGREIINKVLDTRSHTPDWSKANYKANQDAAAAFPTLPDTKIIYGASRRLPRRRPVADVRFQYGVLNLWGLPNPIALVDRSGVWPAPIVSV